MEHAHVLVLELPENVSAHHDHGRRVLGLCVLYCIKDLSLTWEGPRVKGNEASARTLGIWERRLSHPKPLAFFHSFFLPAPQLLTD